MKRSSTIRRLAWLALAGLLPLAGARAETRTWARASGTGDWFEASNWSPAQAPTNAGDSAVITNGYVLLTNETAALSAFSISNATLIFTNWITALRATNVTIRSGATLTLPAAFTNTQMSNRVWVVCSNFLLEGTIQTAGRGYAGGVGMNLPGNGPGGGPMVGSRGGGGGHGGRGGVGDGPAGGVANDVTNEPSYPGSGAGTGNGSASSGAGGGAVRIEAAGSVTINGAINANGTDGTVGQSGGGSGGAIYIGCASFAGTNGSLTAAGGSCAIASPISGGGGGGRIAVVCSSVVQPLSVAFLAPAGSGMYSRTNTYWVNRGAVHGTVYLSNTNLVSATPAGLSGYIILPTSPTVELSDLTQTNGVLGIPEGDTWTVAGNLTISGTGVQVQVSGSSFGTDTNAGASQSTALRCGGDLVLTNGGACYVWAGVTNGAEPAECGALVAVTGAVRLANAAWIYPYSNPTNGGSVRFEMGELAVDSTSGINADERGFRGTMAGNGYGPGHGHAGSRGSGGGYGGTGGNASDGSVGGDAYGQTNAPIAPGSGAGCYSEAGGVGGNGGGLIWIQASNSVVMNGTLTANGKNSNYQAAGSGSGGGILIDCASFSGGSLAVLRAKGGDSPGISSAWGGGGGGGRIAVWIALPLAVRTNLLAGAWPVAGAYSYANIVPGYGGTSSVTNGTGWYNPPTNGCALPGTLVAVVTNPALCNLTIEGDPARYGAPAPQGYWLDVYPPDTVVTNSVVSPADESNGLRRACLGWRLEVTGGTNISSGTTTQAAFAMTTNLTLTWRWTNAWQLTVAAGANGSVNSGAVNGWYTNGAVVTGIAAEADGGYVFSQWASADVPDGMATNNPLTVTMDRARTNLCALFAPASGTTKIWTGTGVWSNSANWSPAGPPGITDQAIIQAGTCMLADPRVAASCTVSNGATLVFSNWPAGLTLTADAIIRSGGTVTLPAAFTNTQMSNRVYIICQNFLLESGGAIQAAGLGYRGGTGNNIPGSGPGGGPASGNRGGGGGHGGRGGYAVSCAGGVPNDFTNAPVCPGSGGGMGDSGTVGHGGGAVRIEAAGTATVNGTINADGTATSGANQPGGGSGGAIYINCASFAGTNGLLTAKGGNSGGTLGGGGGGGRIAVVCADVIKPLSVAFMAQAATSGPYTRLDASWLHYGAVHGTVYLSNTNLVSTTPAGLSGYIILPTSPTVELSDLTQTNGVLGIPEGDTWTVAGNLTISGTGVQVQVSGSSFGTDTNAGASQSTALRCGGDLVLTNGGACYVWAGVTNGAEPAECGALVAVTGAVRLANAAWIYPYSNPTNGGSVRFEMGELAVDSISGINADGRGYRGTTAGAGYGPGGGSIVGPGGDCGGGAGHGGKGGDSSAPGYGGAIYGSTNVPLLAGSGGGSRASGGGSGGCGGGLIWLQAAGGAAVDGTLSANGQDAGNYQAGSGSGGAILINCASFSGGSLAVLRANGGTSVASGATQGGGGGGGRIAVWVDVPPNIRNRYLNDSSAGRAVGITTNWPQFGTVSVASGAGKYAAPDPKAAYPGTVRFFQYIRGGRLGVGLGR